MHPMKEGFQEGLRCLDEPKNQLTPPMGSPTASRLSIEAQSAAEKHPNEKKIEDLCG